jgi:3'-5' exoribonuclease
LDMARKKIEDLVVNLEFPRSINTTFAVLHKSLKIASSGRHYLALSLADKTGWMDGRMFPDSGVEDIYNSIPTGTICRVEGKVNEFPPGSGKMNIVINSLQELCEDEYQLEDFIATSPHDCEKQVEVIRGVIRGMESPELKGLLRSFFCDQEFTAKFYQAPAAMIHHHNYLGGLLDHSVEVLLICERLCELFPQLDRDLLLTGALLHDVGKIRTYQYHKVKIEMSRESVLLDHLYLSADMVRERMESLNFPEELYQQVLHLILSHHGKVSQGWGSSVNPKLPEAMALHHADHLDARVKEMLQK